MPQLARPSLPELDKTSQIAPPEATLPPPSTHSDPSRNTARASPGRSRCQCPSDSGPSIAAQPRHSQSPPQPQTRVPLTWSWLYCPPHVPTDQVTDASAGFFPPPAP